MGVWDRKGSRFGPKTVRNARGAPSRVPGAQALPVHQGSCAACDRTGGTAPNRPGSHFETPVGYPTGQLGTQLTGWVPNWPVVRARGPPRGTADGPAVRAVGGGSAPDRLRGCARGKRETVAPADASDSLASPARRDTLPR